MNWQDAIFGSAWLFAAWCIFGNDGYPPWEEPPTPEPEIRWQWESTKRLGPVWFEGER